MSGQNRYLRGNQNTVLVDVKGATVVEAGDFTFLNDVAGHLGAGSTADNYAYPFSSMAPVSAATGFANIVAVSFIGVAMEGSPSGVTNKITIATSGIFRYPLILHRRSAVTIGALVSSGSPAAGAASGVSDQAAYPGTAYPSGGTGYLGYIVKSQSGASFVDFEIKTKFTGFAT